nr:hypothetical protein [Kibdelosporangium sp. MJ126-NF4]CTQ90853.1 hypothetical protein [Kibdelosporangium sp. MJ126-NF4]
MPPIDPVTRTCTRGSTYDSEAAAVAKWRTTVVIDDSCVTRYRCRQPGVTTSTDSGTVEAL